MRGHLHAIEKLDHCLRAQHDGQGPWLLRRRDHVLEGPPLLERDPIEKAEGRHGDDQGAGGQLSFGGQIHLVGANLLGAQSRPGIGRSGERIGRRSRRTPAGYTATAAAPACLRACVGEERSWTAPVRKAPGRFQAVAEKRMGGSAIAAGGKLSCTPGRRLLDRATTAESGLVQSFLSSVFVLIALNDRAHADYRVERLTRTDG